MATDIRALEARILQLIAQAENQEEPLLRQQTGWARWKSEGCDDDPPEWLMEEQDEATKPFERTAEELYLTAILLLEAQGLKAYLQQFTDKFGSSFDRAKAASDFHFDPEYPNNGYNIFLKRYIDFMRPLNVFKDAQHHLVITGLGYLENILRNTASIIDRSNLAPRSETQVYNAIKPYIEATFPTARSGTSNFIKSNQTYKPDILVPELCAAIEYKYAETESKLKACVGQLADDIKGYTGDPDYNQFFAVFYVTQDFWGPAKFATVWSEMKHPENWRFLYVVGPRKSSGNA